MYIYISKIYPPGNGFTSKSVSIVMIVIQTFFMDLQDFVKAHALFMFCSVGGFAVVSSWHMYLSYKVLNSLEEVTKSYYGLSQLRSVQPSTIITSKTRGEFSKSLLLQITEYETSRLEYHFVQAHDKLVIRGR